MSWAILGSVVVVTLGALVAWRWWLSEAHWAREQKDKQRDELLATLPGRIDELERAAKAAAWAPKR